MTTQTAMIPPLSQSKQGLMACPHLYRDRVINGVDEPESDPQQRGTEVHDMIAAYVEHLVKTRQPSDEPFYQELLSKTVLLHESYEIMSRMASALVIDPEKVLGVEMYLALDKKLNPIEMPTVPRERGHRSEAGVELEGTLDYVQLVADNEAEILDWKSMFAAFDADTFQSRLYPLLLFKHFPFLEKIRFVLRFVRYGTLARDVTFTRENIPELEAEAITERRRQLRLHSAAEMSDLAGDDVGMAWESEKYLGARPGNHCAWCPKMSASIRAQFTAQTIGIAPNVDQSLVCPLASINPFVQQTPEDSLRYAVFMDQARNENARILREFVQASGPVTISDANGQTYTAGYELTGSNKYPALETIEALQEWKAMSGEDLLPKVFVGSTELNPLLKAKKRFDLNGRMQMLAVTITKTKWHIGKSGEEEDGE